MHQAPDLSIFPAELHIASKNLTREPWAVCSLAYQAEKTSTKETFKWMAKKCSWCSLCLNKAPPALCAHLWTNEGWFVWSLAHQRHNPRKAPCSFSLCKLNNKPSKCLHTQSLSKHLGGWLLNSHKYSCKPIHTCMYKHTHIYVWIYVCVYIYA